ncbi:MAG: GNAT family N-acetyltransferase [Psychrosphaera sp.]|nr:GNAT family N-acetyltransferase [Psychrosphaera sp.]
MLPITDIITLSKSLSLTTERLTLRLFQATDLDCELKQQQDPEVVRYIREPLSNEQAVESFEAMLKPWQGNDREWLGLCVTRTADQQALGTVSFRFEVLDFAITEIGYRFRPEYQGQGYAFEAVTALVEFLFGTLKVHKVIAICDPRNTASFKLMQKLGMEKEGLQRQHYKIGEQYSDALLAGLLAEDWAKMSTTSALISAPV